MDDRAISLVLPSTGCEPKPFIGISMFDWPEQSHTSPIRISENVLDFFPEPIFRVYFSSDAAGVLTETFHTLSFPAVVLREMPSQLPVTVISVPGRAFPHTGASADCCRTMPSVNIEAILT